MLFEPTGPTPKAITGETVNFMVPDLKIPGPD
jgi:hypothetical protein